MSLNKGILFFDIDGTIFDDSRNLPDSVLPALEAAHRNGHQLIINTGRTYCNQDHRLDPFPLDGSTNPFFMPDGRALCEEDLTDADAAIYVISRIAGEGADRTLEPGDYYLTAQELSDLLFLNAHGIPTVLVINTGGPVQIADVT